MQPRMNLITLGTHDLPKATHFYEKGLGFPKMDLKADIVFFTLQGTWLALYPWELLRQDTTASAPTEPQTGFYGVTLSHVVASEEEVKATLEEARAAGATIVKPAQKADWGGFSGYFTDLDGHLWEIAFNPFFWPGPQACAQQS